MKNKINSPKNLMAGLAIFAGVLATSKDSLAQNLTANQQNKANTENVVTKDANVLIQKDPLAFVQQNIGKYYPNPVDVEHVNNLITRIGNWKIKNAINEIIIATVLPEISDPKQQIRTIIRGLERYVFAWLDFQAVFSNNNYPENPDNWKVSRKFGRECKARFDENMEQLQKDIEQWEERIKQWEERIEQLDKDIKQWEERIKQWEERIKQWEERIKQWEERIKQLDKDIEQWNKKLEENRLEIEKMLQSITPDMMKADPEIKKIIIKRQQRYKDLNQTPSDPHIISLFEALK